MGAAGDANEEEKIGTRVLLVGQALVKTARIILGPAAVVMGKPVMLPHVAPSLHYNFSQY